MALLFSAVTVTSKGNQVEVLLPGIPTKASDLIGWKHCDALLAAATPDEEIRVHAAACLYGEGEVFKATVEEVAYFTLRYQADENFLEDHCKSAGHSDYSFRKQILQTEEEHKMNDWERQHRMAERYKQEYPAGTRILLLHMGNDPHPLPNGMRGTVTAVDDLGTVFAKWDNGRSLGLVPGEDSFRKLTAEELAEEQAGELDEAESGPVMEM